MYPAENKKEWEKKMTILSEKSLSTVADGNSFSFPQGISKGFVN